MGLEGEDASAGDDSDDGDDGDDGDDDVLERKEGMVGLTKVLRGGARGLKAVEQSGVGSWTL